MKVSLPVLLGETWLAEESHNSGSPGKSKIKRLISSFPYSFSASLASEKNL